MNYQQNNQFRPSQDWKSQFPNNLRIDNVRKLYQAVFHSMAPEARTLQMQENLKTKSQEYESSQFNNSPTREVYLGRIAEQLQKINNNKQQISQLGQGNNNGQQQNINNNQINMQQPGANMQNLNIQQQQNNNNLSMNMQQQSSVNMQQNLQQSMNMQPGIANMGLNIQQPMGATMNPTMNTRSQVNAQLQQQQANLQQPNIALTVDQQKQYMQLQQMTQFNANLMNQLINKQPGNIPQQQQFQKPGPNFPTQFPYQQPPVPQKLIPKSPAPQSNLPPRQLNVPTLSQVMQKYPSRDPKVVAELLRLEATTTIPTNILDLSDASKKEVVDVVIISN